MSARTPQARLIGIAAAVLVLLLLGLAATRGTTDRTERVRTALASAGIEDARAERVGSRLVIRGIADSEAERDRAVASAEAAAGSLTISDRLEVGGSASEPVLVAGATLTPAAVAPALSAAQAAPSPPPAPHRTARTPAAPEASTAPAVGSTPCEQATAHTVRIDFLANSGTPSGDMMGRLDRLAKQLQACPSLLVKVRAHTEPGPSVSKDLALSRQRAEAVATHLQRRSVARDRVVPTYAGRGELAQDTALVSLIAGWAP